MSKSKKVELQLGDILSERLAGVLVSNDTAKILIETFLTGAGLEGKNFTLKADFTLIEAEVESKTE